MTTLYRLFISAILACSFAILVAGCGKQSDDSTLPHDSSVNKSAPAAAADGSTTPSGKKAGMAPPPP